MWLEIVILAGIVVLFIIWRIQDRADRNDLIYRRMDSEHRSFIQSRASEIVAYSKDNRLDIKDIDYLIDLIAIEIECRLEEV